MRPNVEGEHTDAREHAEGRTLQLPVDRIRPYARNPRRGENPAYAAIKASILAEGLDQPLVVTQRPGDGDYTLHGGGNTRLRILQELFAETGEDRFGEVTCCFRPWSGESDVLLAHLRENDLRGALTFLDKARAIVEAKALMEAETGIEALSQNRLAAMLRERGYAVNQGLLSLMFYAVERLELLLPVALQAGMGRPQIGPIRQLEGAAHSLWLALGLGPESDYDEVFATLCRRYDGPDWDINRLRRALEAEIAEGADVNLHAVSLELEGHLQGRRSDGLSPVSSKQNAVDAIPTGKPTTALSEFAIGANKEPATPRTTDEDEEAAHPWVPIQHGKDQVGAVGSTIEPKQEDAQDTASTGSLDSPLTEPTSDTTDFDALRQRLATLACGLADRHGLGDRVKPWPDNGLGFVVIDVPDSVLLDELDAERLIQVSTLWWTLAAAAEMTVAPLEHLLPALDTTSVLYRALEAQDADLLFSSVQTLDPGQVGYRLWRHLDDRDWADLLALMGTYRDLYRAVERSGEPLWR